MMCREGIFLPLRFLWIYVNTGVSKHSASSPSWVSEDLKQRTSREVGSRFFLFDTTIKNKGNITYDTSSTC